MLKLKILCKFRWSKSLLLASCVALKEQGGEKKKKINIVKSSKFEVKRKYDFFSFNLMLYLSFKQKHKKKCDNLPFLSS